MKQKPSFRPIDPRTPIRDQLERDARRRHAALAERMEHRRQRQRRLSWQDRALLILGAVLFLALLVRVQTASAQEDGWGIQFESDRHSYAALALDTAIHVEVTGLLARVHVLQTFRNDGLDWAEGVYRFPLPPGAAVDRLLIRVGERVLEGEIRERESAQRIYQKARADGQAASLVDQERTNQFRTKLANIGPGEEIRVLIGFLVNVEYRDGTFSLRIPTTFNRRYGRETQPGLGAPAPRPVLASTEHTSAQSLELEVELHTGIGLAAIESRYHDVDIQPVPEGYRVTLTPEGWRTDRDFELAWYPEAGASPQASLTTFDDGDWVYAQLMLVPPADDALLPQPREVVFVIDTSGSMQGASLEQARAALLLGLGALRATDHFNLIQFNSVTDSLFPASVPALPGNLQRARDYLHSLRADGGTVMAPALRRALTLPLHEGLMRQVVFITDGSVGNERQLLAEIAESLGEARLFTVAIGSAPNSWFMRKAAEIGRGSHTHIGRLEEVEQRMASLWPRIRLPAISDVCIDWGPDAEYYPEVIPDLYAGAPLWVAARLPEAPSTIRLCGELNGMPWDHELSPWPAGGSESLATLWARKKVEALEDGLVFGFDPEVVKSEVTSVALRYGLLTSHTSLVAVDHTPARAAAEPLTSVNIPSLLPAGGSAHVAGFPPTGAGWRLQLVLSLIALLVAGWLFFSPGAVTPVTASRSSR